VPKSEELFPKITVGTGGAAESDPIATVAIKSLSDAVALLPTNATLAPIKNDITAIQEKAKEFASKTDLAAANAVLTTITDAVKALEASGSPTALKALQDAVAKAEADITALKTKQDEHAAALQKTTGSLADLAIVVAKLGLDGITGTAIATIQTRLDNLDKGKADKPSLDALTKSVQDLTTALQSGATDQELTTAIAAVDKTITALEAATKAAADILAAKIKANADAIATNKVDIKTNVDAIAELQKSGGGIIFYGATDKVIQDTNHEAIFEVGLKSISLPPGSAGRNYKLGSFEEVLVNTANGELLTDGASTDTQLLINAYRQNGGVFWYQGKWQIWGMGQAAVGATGGDRIEYVVLPLLRANTWTTFPAPTDGSTINDYSILDSIKRDITSTVEIDPDGDTWKVRSLIEKTNLQFRYELGAKP
jgi:hypothetical protein